MVFKKNLPFIIKYMSSYMYGKVFIFLLKFYSKKLFINFEIQDGGITIFIR